LGQACGAIPPTRVESAGERRKKKLRERRPIKSSPRSVSRSLVLCRSACLLAGSRRSPLPHCTNRLLSSESVGDVVQMPFPTVQCGRLRAGSRAFSCACARDVLRRVEYA
jgi:hypothetical protein